MFSEDFDRAPMMDHAPPPNPDADPDRLERARTAGWDDGYATGYAAGQADRAAETHELARHIAHRIEALAKVSTRRIDEAAQALAELLLTMLNQAFPVLCERYGVAEIAAVATAILPNLERLAFIQVTVAREHLTFFREYIQTLDKRLAEKTTVMAHERCGRADIFISWPDGDAARDGREIWQDITEALQLHGLNIAPIDAPPTERELVHAE